MLLTITHYHFSSHDICLYGQLILCNSANVLKLDACSFCVKLLHLLLLLNIALYLILPRALIHSEIVIQSSFVLKLFPETLYSSAYLQCVAFQFWVLLCMYYLWLGHCTQTCLNYLKTLQLLKYTILLILISIYELTVPAESL